VLRALLALLAAAALLVAWLLPPAPPALAAVIKPFSVRFTANANGDIAIIGNVVTTCPPAASHCTEALNRTASGAALNNNAYSMQYVDVDAADTPPGGAPNNSSSATLTLPAGATGSDVLFAGLYWGGKSTNAGRTTVRFRPPGTGYQALTGELLGVFGSEGAYQAFADVTALVRAAGGGAYTVGGLYAGLGEDHYGAWSLVVAYRDPTPGAPPRNLTVFDGFANVQNLTSGRTVDVPVSGFLTPPPGRSPPWSGSSPTRGTPAWPEIACSTRAVPTPPGPSPR
jgi:hypothetical protein